jgi:hypothetical protein
MPAELSGIHDFQSIPQSLLGDVIFQLLFGDAFPAEGPGGEKD